MVEWGAMGWGGLADFSGEVRREGERCDQPFVGSQGNCGQERE